MDEINILVKYMKAWLDLFEFDDLVLNSEEEFKINNIYENDNATEEDKEVLEKFFVATLEDQDLDDILDELEDMSDEEKLYFYNLKEAIDS